MILDGAGRVDVALERDSRRIACEISVTTNQDHELGNVEKCLAAGYAEVIVVGTSERQTKALAASLGEISTKRIKGECDTYCLTA